MKKEFRMSLPGIGMSICADVLLTRPRTAGAPAADSSAGARPPGSDSGLM